MPRYKILIEYDGTNFNGWQKQTEGRTVEDEIEKSLTQILRVPVDIIGQGRTDSGVHAEGQVAHFDFEEDLEREKILRALLGVLPRDVAVWDIEQVHSDFHARFDAIGRAYRYQFVTRRSPLLESYAEMVLEDLNLEVMQRCAGLLVGRHDFSGFTKTDPEQEGTECEVTFSEFSSEGDHLLVYRISANRFLRHMVRRLAGTILQVGLGKRPEEEFKRMLTRPTPDDNAYGAAAKGLILERVEYKKDGNLP